MDNENIQTCEHCGEVIETEPFEVDGHIFCCEECARQDGAVECANCGELFIPDERPEAEQISGDWFCSIDCAHDGGWEYCARCGDWVLSDDAIEAGGNLYCSEDCAHGAGYEVCEYCGEWFDSANDGFYADAADAWYCSDDCAYNDGLECCRRCGEWTADNRTVMTRYGEECWCDSCADYYAHWCDECEQYEADSYECENCGTLHRYGWTPSLRMFGLAGPYLGVELETDGGSSRDSYIRELAKIDGFTDHFWMTEDGSLNYGVEITSMPMTLGYHLSKRQSIYEAIGEAASSNGFSSHNAGTCGLHVHVNRDFFGKSKKLRDLRGYMMMRLLQRFEPMFTLFSRRTSDRWCRYKTCYDYTYKTTVGIIPKVGANEVGHLGTFEKAQMMGRETAHSQALNFEHRDTFEFRIFRGTLKWDTFFASLSLVDGIANLVKEKSAMYVETVDWYTLMDDVVKSCSEPEGARLLHEYLVEKQLVMG